jgi:hypothetical protein
MTQRVLITAGAAGIGREFARAFAANGAKVFVCDINDKALTDVRKEIPSVIARHCDMGLRAEIERMVPEAVAALGGLDVLINNAGIAGLTLSVEELSTRQLGQSGRGKPHRYVRRLTTCHPTPKEIEGRLHHQHVVDRRPRRLREPLAIRGDQMGRDRSDKDAGTGTWSLGHPRQRDRAWRGRRRAHYARVSGARTDFRQVDG